MGQAPHQAPDEFRRREDPPRQCDVAGWSLVASRVADPALWWEWPIPAVPQNAAAVPTATCLTGLSAKGVRMGLDVSAVRTMYPALAGGYAYLDGAAGTQLPRSVIDAISDAHRSGLGNSDGAFPASA